MTLLAQIALILAFTRLMGWVFSRFRQPQVLGEIIAGIVLGPGVLGWAAPQTHQQLFGPQTMPILATLSQFALIFVVFLIGLQLDPAQLKARGKAITSISLLSTAIPLVLGFFVTAAFYPWTIALAVAIALSVTAFPVFSSALHSREIARAAALITTFATWLLLLTLILLQRHSLHTTVATALYLAAMALLIRPLLGRLALIFEQRGRLGHNMLAAILLLLIASSWMAHRIGLHALFGALLLGVIMPRNAKFIRHLTEKLQDFVFVLLLPLFFGYLGQNTQINLLNSPQMWMVALLLLSIAAIGKIGGTFLAGQLANLPWRDSTAVGILLNTRGLMFLIIVSVAFQLHLISAPLLAMLILIGLATTAMTMPLLNWLCTAPSPAPDQSAKAAQFCVLIPISLPKSGGPLVQIADALIGPARASGQLLALHLRRPMEHESLHPLPDESESDASLMPLLSQAQARALPVQPIAFVSNDIPTDIAQTAANQSVNLVLMGYHNPIFGKAMLGGTVHRVLSTCPADVGVFVDRGLRNIDRILIPYLGSPHDALALELAARIVHNTSAQATTLHVVPPMSVSAAKSAEARRAVEKIFGSALENSSTDFQVVEDSSPVGVVLHQARNFDLVIIGVAEEWGLESRLFGWRPEKIAQDCPASLLIVRKFANTQESGASARLQQPNPAPKPTVAM